MGVPVVEHDEERYRAYEGGEKENPPQPFLEAAVMFVCLVAEVIVLHAARYFLVFSS